MAKIVRIATVIKKEVLQILNKESSSTKPWTAFAELQKKIQMVKNSIQDNKYIKILEKELFSLQEDLEMTMRTASKQRESLVSLAERDAEDAFPKLNRTVPSIKMILNFRHPGFALRIYVKSKPKRKCSII